MHQPPENIIYRQVPRNRRIAEVFQKCGLVERSGQGADKMFRRAVEEAKPLPDYAASDDFSVKLRLRADIQDVQFLLFFERLAKEREIHWAVTDLILLDNLRQGKRPPLNSRETLHRMKEQNIIETVGRGRGTRYILAKRFYTFVGERGAYTRRKGLDREEKKALIIKHLQEYEKGYIEDLEQAIPSLRRSQIHTLLKVLKKERKIERVGSRRGGHWKLIK